MHQTTAQTDACAAAGRQRNCASTYQRLPVTTGLGPRLRLGAGGCKIEFNTFGDASAPGANDFRGVAQIFEARVHAREQIRLLDRHVFTFHFRQRNHRFYFVRPGHMWNDRLEIEFKLDRILGVGIGAEFAAIFPPLLDIGVCVTGPALRAARSRAFRIGELGNARAQVVHGCFIERKNACQRAPFCSHVRNRHSR